MIRNFYRVNFIGCFFCFFLLSFFSFQSNAYPATSTSLDTIQKIYIGYYQRPADPAGLIYWAGTLDANGGNLTAVIDAFANSPESKELYGTINTSNISTIVNDIYNALLARNAEPAGLAYWVGEFNSGRITAANIMLTILNGAQNEDLQSINNKVIAANLFTRSIDPDLDGNNLQVTYAQDDVIAARNFLNLYATSVKVPTQAETTAYIKTNIANSGDSILSDGTEIKLLDLSTIAGVSNNPPNKTTFTLSSSTHITKILTYHWNSGRGDTPGTLSLKDTLSGTVYGPWTVIASKTSVDFTPGATWPTTASGPPYLYWSVQPAVDVPAGIYEVVDSNPTTWSYASDTGNKGIAFVYGWASGGDTEISLTYTQGDMAGETAFYSTLSTSLTKTTGALLQAILSVNSFLFTDFSNTTIETVRNRKTEADKALETLATYSTETADFISANSTYSASRVLLALSPQDVLATINSGISNRPIKTLMTAYNVNAKKAQLILNTAMAGLESSNWNDEAELNNKVALGAAAIRDTAALTLTIAGTVPTAGAVSGTVTVMEGITAIISGADGVIKVAQSGTSLVIGKEITVPDGSKASMVLTTVSAVSDIIGLKSLGKMTREENTDNVGNVCTITAKIIDGFVDKTITLGPVKVDISNGLSIGSSVDLGYIKSKLEGTSDAPSTMPGSYKINGVKTVVSTLPDTMTKALDVIPVTAKVDTTKITGTTATPTFPGAAASYGSCTVKDGGTDWYCYNFSGAIYSDPLMLATRQSFCSGMGSRAPYTSTWSNSGCPSGGVIFCPYDRSAASMDTSYQMYYYGAISLDPNAGPGISYLIRNEASATCVAP